MRPVTLFLCIVLAETGGEVCAVEDAARRADSWLELCLKELLNKIKKPKHADMHCRSDHCHKELMKPKKGVEL